MSTITKESGHAVVPVGSGKRSSAIDGIRGLASLALLTVHVAIFSGLLGTKALGEPRPPSNVFGAFLVSGFPSFIGVLFVLPAMYLYLPLAKAIITGTRRPPQGRSFVRRLVRLLPAYYVLYVVVLLTLNRSHIDGVWYVLRHVLLLQIYSQSPTTPVLTNGLEITWTVPSMVQWYAALPLIAWAVHRFAARGATPAARARRLMVPVPVLIAIGVGWLFYVKGHGWDNRIVFWWPQGFAPTIGIGMALGIKLALAQVSPPDTPRLFRAAAARPYLFWFGAVVVYLVNCARPFSVIGMDAIYSTSGLLVTYVMVAAFGLLAVLPLVVPGARPHAVSAVLGSRPLAYVGRVSYGIYLWHFAVMHFYLQPDSIFGGNARPLREFYGTVGFWRLEIITVLGTLLFATLSYYLVEQPAVRLSEHLLRRYRPRVPAETGAPAPPVPATQPPGGDPPDETAATVLAAESDRDAIRSNLLELESSLGHQLLSGVELTGRTRARWAAATADLTTLWEIFAGYSAVVDDARQVLDGVRRRPSPADAARIDQLLSGPSILLTGAPVPLARRHITDTGQVRLTPGAAVERMHELFARTADLVTTVEAVWRAVSARIDELAATLAAIPGGSPDAEADLRHHRHVLSTDPLSRWQDNGIDVADLDRLRERLAAGRPVDPTDTTRAA